MTATKTKTAKTTKVAKPAKAKKAEPKHNPFVAIAATTNGNINATEARILKALRDAKKALSRDDLKEAVGIGRDGKYSKAWLDHLKSLDARKLIKISVAPDGAEFRGYTHAITAKGTAVIDKAVKAAK